MGMGGVVAGAASDAAAKFVLFLCIAFPVAVMIASVAILLVLALVDRDLRVGPRIFAIAGAATASCICSLIVIVGVAYLLSLFGVSPDYIGLPAGMAAIWLSLVGWQLALAIGIFHKRDVAIHPARSG